MKFGVITVIFTFLAMLLAGCEADPQHGVAQNDRAQPQTKAEVDFAISVLAGLQGRSVSQNREFCGFIGLTAEGALAASPPLRGQEAGCRPEEPPAGFTILASYHTHGAYSEEFDSEVPSLDDLWADIHEGIDGYVSTPGGRIWFNSSAQRKVRQLCGVGCILSDPNFQPELVHPVAKRYDLAGLKIRENLTYR